MPGNPRQLDRKVTLSYASTPGFCFQMVIHPPLAYQGIHDRWSYMNLLLPGMLPGCCHFHLSCSEHRPPLARPRAKALVRARLGTTATLPGSVRRVLGSVRRVLRYPDFLAYQVSTDFFPIIPIGKTNLSFLSGTDFNPHMQLLAAALSFLAILATRTGLSYYLIIRNDPQNDLISDPFSEIIINIDAVFLQDHINFTDSYVLSALERASSFALLPEVPFVSLLLSVLCRQGTQRESETLA
jgi:hypothetical protein